MARPRAVHAKLALTAILSAGLLACSPIQRSHGYAPSDEDLAGVTVGVDTRDSVAELVGPPTMGGVMRDDAWYYVQSDWETVGFREPKETERQVVAISFDKAGTVENVERFGLEDGRVIALNRRVTESNIKGVSFLRQMLGNIGQFNAEDIIGDR
ncbi:Beta-barrel assembly machine subunit BamE [Rhodovulum kholense]|uniref:Beta-barrel assembly machine subunit BamE n=2 Tax=Rhodovulum TaxID=34008 RepID=A0A8E2VI12_9RHOB|nr:MULTISPECIES: outer membrane protein assembly factor BamE [Rhodovulum]PTW47046.1 Beta-barrel assembly machine subunit BamE [Rhodovulum kholense]RAP41587.1 hypothetical protein BYZ73_10025 [Rhodovulum viride]